jgi:NO-binding membrane sensor protein with MHYT domain
MTLTINADGDCLTTHRSLLAYASITMGGIAVWSMHFIGSRAIILGDGQIQLQLVYDPLLTTLSFFMPIVVIFVAFAAVGTSDKFNLVRLLLGGALAGLGALGMHYLGQASVVNYDCIFPVGNVVGAALVAIATCIVALGVFFVLKKAWNASWWKRGVCASILAGAVTGMHWLASSGTVYRLKKDAPSGTNSSRTATTVAVIVFVSVYQKDIFSCEACELKEIKQSFGGCSSLFCVALYATAKKLRAARKARQVSLATAIFDLDGKLMVTTGGLLPAKKITNSFLEQVLSKWRSFVYYAYNISVFG